MAPAIYIGDLACIPHTWILISWASPGQHGHLESKLVDGRTCSLSVSASTLNNNNNKTIFLKKLFAHIRHACSCLSLVVYLVIPLCLEFHLRPHGRLDDGDYSFSCSSF